MMFRKAGWAIVWPALLLLAGCDSAETDGPGGVTVGEAKALGEAAEMLDEQRLPSEAASASSAPVAAASASAAP